MPKQAIRDKTKRKLISVVVPAYNEEDNILNVYNTVKSVFEDSLNNRYDFEIVFTDNHSEDSTIDVIGSIAKNDTRVKAVRFTRNFGFNKSLLTAYRISQGDAAIQLDADLQDPPELFPKFLEHWEKGHDVVVGARRMREESAWLQNLRRIFYRFLKRISDDNLVIDGGDFRLIDRKIIEQLREIHEAAPYVRGLVSTLATNQISFLYDRRAREFGQSKFPVMKLIGLATDGIINHSTAPLRLATMLGFGLAGLTFFIALGYLVGRLTLNINWPVGFATSVILQLMSISVNAILLGIIGEYLSRIHQQMKQRPLTIFERCINIAPHNPIRK